MVHDGPDYSIHDGRWHTLDLNMVSSMCSKYCSVAWALLTVQTSGVHNTANGMCDGHLHQKLMFCVLLAWQQVDSDSSGGAGGARIMPSPASVPALSPLAAELAAVEEEGEEVAAAACMVCREGYSLRPSQLLGAYCYCRAATANEYPGCAPPTSSLPSFFTTVSHFNLIHVGCHEAARAADAALRQPKREWDGATLRNGEVLCNNLLPVRGGCVSDTAYVAAAVAHWDTLMLAPGSSGSSTSRRITTMRALDSTALRLSLVTADLAALLLRFAYQRSFSDQARGGGRASNARLLPALLQLGCYYACQAHGSSELKEQQQLLAAVAEYGQELEGPKQTPAGTKAAVAAPVSSKAGDMRSKIQRCVPHVLALSLLLHSPEDWASCKSAMLVLSIKHGLVQYITAAGADTTDVAAVVHSLTDEQLFEAVAPMLRLFGLVDWLQQRWKSDRVATTTVNWAVDMDARLQDLSSCLAAADEWMEYLGELEDAFGLQDLFDILGLLGLVLGGAGGLLGGGDVDSCEAFVKAACTV